MVAKSEIEVAFLSDSPLFEGLGEEEIRGLVEKARLQKFKAGEVVVEEGSMGDAIYLLHSGEISVRTRDEEGNPITLASLSDRGAFFGEVALADPGPRSATVRAESKAAFLVLSLEALDAFFRVHPEAQVVILRNIARVLARRLRDSNALVVSISSS